jgi:GAF domain-containing protein
MRARTSAGVFNADRLTLYAVNEDRSAIISKVKTGLNTSRDLKLPISAQSIAGYVAMSQQMVNIVDVYDDEALKRVHPKLSFLQEVDKRSGYRTRQMLVAPVMDGETLYGVLQVINNRSDQPFGKLEEDGARQLSRTLGIAIRQRLQRAGSSTRSSSTPTTRRCRTFTSNRCRARPRPAFGSGLTAHCSLALRCQPSSGRPW